MRENKSYKEQTADAITSLGKEVFTTLDLGQAFPERKMNSISATLCALVSDGIIYRTGKRVRGNSPKSTVVQYTTSIANSAEASKVTEQRGYSNAERSNINGDREKLEDKIRLLSDQVTRLNYENRRLKKIISQLPREYLVNLVLS
jgi:hypothetical protein